LTAAAIGIAAVVVVLSLVAFIDDQLWLRVAAVLSILLATIGYLYQRWQLNALRQNILQAQEGLLQPLPTNVSRGGAVGRVIIDYNRMLAILTSMFSTVEECQGRVANERNKINALLQSLPGALLSVDDNLRINSVNRQAELFFHFTSGGLVGQNLFDVLQLDDDDRNILRDTFLYKRALYNQQIDLIIDGKRHFFSLNLSFLTQQDADMGAVITLQDMSEYRQLQESVAMREKLVAMGEFAAGVAHELNTPLGNILGYTRLLGDSVTDNNDQRTQYLEIIADEAKRCSRIIQDLLNYARRERCDNDSCDVNQVVREVVETFISCRLRRMKIDLQIELESAMLLVQGGCGEFEIVLTNLMLNAMQALRQTTQARISIRSWHDDHGSVYVCVEDNGPGVSREHRSRIFDPFFTTKEVGEGSGLGLSIGQAMLAKRGAEIRLDPGYEQGARFIVKMPEYLECENP
jgi:two-component system, NtrC family, sensor kinase